jgi:hypothetical protein
MSVPYAAGALDSSTEDLLRWQTSLHGGRLLTAEGLGEMGRPVREDYAMGLIRREQKGIVVLEHGGGIEGFNTQLAWQPFGLGRFAVFIAPAGPIRRRFLASKCHYATRNLRRMVRDMGANPIEGPSPTDCLWPASPCPQGEGFRNSFHAKYQLHISTFRN